MPRGARLVNTDWIYGVVVYSGKQTKLMMNSTRTVTKRFVRPSQGSAIILDFQLLRKQGAQQDNDVPVHCAPGNVRHKLGTWRLFIPPEGGQALVPRHIRYTKLRWLST